MAVVTNSQMLVAIGFLGILLPFVCGFRTGLEEGLICNVCVGTHPGCGLYDFDQRWYWGKMCPRYNDKCVKVIERKGSEVVVTRDCLSNLENFRIDIPADKYEGCRPASHDIKLGQYVFNRIEELDIRRNYYDNTTFCFCDFDHWCNSALVNKVSVTVVLTLVLTVILI